MFDGRLRNRSAGNPVSAGGLTPGLGHNEAGRNFRRKELKNPVKQQYDDTTNRVTGQVLFQRKPVPFIFPLCFAGGALFRLFSPFSVQGALRTGLSKKRLICLGVSLPGIAETAAAAP